MDNVPDPAGIPQSAPLGGLSFNLGALIKSPIFWMAVGAGVVLFVQYKNKQPRQVNMGRAPVIDV